MMNTDQVVFKLPVSLLSARCLLSRANNMNNFLDLWPWQQNRVLNPLGLPLAALWIPRARRKRDNECDLVDAASESSTHRDHSRKRPRGKEDLQRLARLVSSRVGHQVSALRRQAGRLQQKAKEQRGASRAAKRGDRKRQKGEGHRFFQRRVKPEAAAAELLARAQEYERQLDVRSAIKCYEEAADLLPSCQTLAFCSKAWSDTTYLDEIKGAFREALTDDMKRSANEIAVSYGEKAMALDPNVSLPHVAACISMGRLALLSENKIKVRLAKEAREHAILAIAKEPTSDLAHHLMGRWHWEMAQLNVVARTLIRLAFGTALPSGSHQDALESYARATELNPARLIHRVELGRAYHKLGRRQEAWRELEAAVLLDVEDINAHLQKIDAQDLLKSLRQDAKRLRWVADPTAKEGSGVHPTTSGAVPEGFVITVPRFRLPDNFRIPAFSWPSSGKPRGSSCERPGDTINDRDGPIAA